MRIFNSMDISSSGLTASRVRMDVISSNLANVNSTRTEKGNPYRRKLVTFQEKELNFRDSLFRHLKENKKTEKAKGVIVGSIIEDKSPFKLVYDPAHPDANEAGYVQMPNVNVVSEMVDLISATRAYEANVTAINSAKNMAVKALEIGRG